MVIPLWWETYLALESSLSFGAAPWEKERTGSKPVTLIGQYCSTSSEGSQSSGPQGKIFPGPTNTDVLAPASATWHEDTLDCRDSQALSGLDKKDDPEDDFQDNASTMGSTTRDSSGSEPTISPGLVTKIADIFRQQLGLELSFPIPEELLSLQLVHCSRVHTPQKEMSPSQWKCWPSSDGSYTTRNPTWSHPN